MNVFESVKGFFDPAQIISFLTSPKALWYLIGFIFLIYSIISCVLLYHWRKYGLGGRLIKFAELSYFSVSILLFISIILVVLFI